MKKLNGFSALEVIIAAAIFVIFASSTVGLVIQSYNSNRQGAEFTIASQYAAEGIEALRSISNRRYGNLINSNNTGVVISSGVWTLSGTNNIFDKYTRILKIESVNRDVDGNIVATGGNPDGNTKKVTSTVTWDFVSGRQNNLALTSYLTNWRAPIVSGGPIMMAYSKTTNVPFYRIWNGSSWSTEGSAQTVGGNINYIVLKSSRTRNEAILGTLDSNGNIYIQIWNGTNWGTLTQIASIGSANATTRSFDIEYEKSGDRAVITYLPTSTSSDFAYQYWDGSNLSLATTVTAPPTIGVIKSIDLAQNPGSSSNEIALIMYDANSDVYGMVWNGTGWDDMNAGGTEPVWDATASTATEKKPIAVAYEQTSGRAMFIWADSTTDNQNYRIWNGTSLTAASTLTIANSTGVGEWVQLASRPNSNELMYGVQDGGAAAELNTRKWTGSGWDAAHPEHDAGTENITSMNFDLVWETHSSNPGIAWLLYGDGARVTAKRWSSTTNSWTTNSTNLTGSSDDTSFIRLKADSSSGAVFAGIYEDSSAGAANRDIWESRLTGGGTTWSAKNTIWGGPTSASPVFFRVDISTP